MPVLTSPILLLGPPTSVHFQRWTYAAVAYGLDVHVAGRATTFEGGGIFTTLPSGMGRVGYALGILPLARLVRRLRPSLVHAHYATSYGVMAALATPPSIPIVLTCWGSDILVEPERSRTMRFLAKVALRRATLVSSMAFHMTEKLTEMGVAADRIVTLPFGADLATFACNDQQRRESHWDVITTRALEPQYNVDLLLHALASVRNRTGVEPRTVIIGDGSQSIPLHKLAVQLGLKDVHFLGRLAPSRIAHELCASSVFISLANSDGNNVSLNEAMAAGVLPVATDNPASREWLTHGVNGLLTALQVEDVAGHLGRALTDLRLARRARAINRTLVDERASWEKQARQMFGLYEALAMREARGKNPRG